MATAEENVETGAEEVGYGIFGQFETDEALEVRGAPVRMQPNKDGSIPTFYIAAANNSNEAYAKELEKATKPYRRNMGAIPPKLAEKIYKDIFIKTVLKGWENVQNKNGEPVPYSEGHARGLMETLPRLYQELTQRANDIETFKAEAREDEAKNS